MPKNPEPEPDDDHSGPDEANVTAPDEARAEFAGIAQEVRDLLAEMAESARAAREDAAEMSGLLGRAQGDHAGQGHLEQAEESYRLNSIAGRTATMFGTVAAMISAGVLSVLVWMVVDDRPETWHQLAMVKLAAFTLSGVFVYLLVHSLGEAKSHRQEAGRLKTIGLGLVAVGTRRGLFEHTASDAALIHALVVDPAYGGQAPSADWHPAAVRPASASRSTEREAMERHRDKIREALLDASETVEQLKAGGGAHTDVRGVGAMLDRLEALARSEDVVLIDTARDIVRLEGRIARARRLISSGAPSRTVRTSAAVSEDDVKSAIDSVRLGRGTRGF